MDLEVVKFLNEQIFRYHGQGKPLSDREIAYLQSIPRWDWDKMLKELPEAKKLIQTH